MDVIRKLREYTSKLIVCISFALPISMAVAQTLPVTSVGRTSGDFAVSPAGQATYQIPVWVPPGVRVLQPQLALTYSSQGGDGLIGPGWSISGLSQISRCQKTIEQDGYREAVLLTLADAFCINGRRLRLTSAAGTYGQPNSTYQTEIADYSLVIANGSTGNGSTWFEVKAANGLIYEFGNSSTSRAVLSGTATPYLWALSKVRDRQGPDVPNAWIKLTYPAPIKP